MSLIEDEQLTLSSHRIEFDHSQHGLLIGGQINNTGRLHGIGYSLTIDKDKDKRKGLIKEDKENVVLTHGEYKNGKL